MGELLNGILQMLGGLGVFMLGMRLMSEGIERSAGRGMRKVFGKISNNRFAGVGVGAAVTGIIQSSSATTVMVIGFVNAGLMTLFQATSIIMGANIGTTVTALIVSLKAIPVVGMASLLSLVGVFIMMFAKNNKLKNIGTMLTGLGTIFVSLSIMSNALRLDSINEMFTNLFRTVRFPLLLILIGVAATGVLQSSSAVTGMVVTLVTPINGISVLPMNSAIFIVLGSNIGTCVTAMIASIGASTNAKRAALIHLMFNVIGTVFFTAIVWPLGNYIVYGLQAVIDKPEMQIALFHLLFNIFTALLLLPFIKQMVFIAEHVLVDKGRIVSDMFLEYLDERILETPPIAVSQVLKEVRRMGDLAKDNLELAARALFFGESANIEKVIKTEKQIDFINKGINGYLVKIAALNITDHDKDTIGSLHHVISDLERIGDHAVNITELSEDMEKENMLFTDEAKFELNTMLSKVMQHFDVTMEIFTAKNLKLINQANDLEEEIDQMKKNLGDNHIARLRDGKCSVESGNIFFSTITALERVADHLTNIAYSVYKRVNTNTKIQGESAT